MITRDMLEKSAQKIVESLSAEDQVLDVGSWYKPFPRADWVVDLMPYETRGQPQTNEPERFDESRWLQFDICSREPWPFSDDQFDFVICSHTLEDVRDPIWVCSELSRVAKAGYIEIPSRLEEQTWGVNGDWAGWSHHRWLIDVSENAAEFTLKPHFMHARPDLQISIDSLVSLGPEARVSPLFWTSELQASERMFHEAEGLTSYLRQPIEAAGLTPRSEERFDLRRRLRYLRARLRSR